MPKQISSRGTRDVHADSSHRRIDEINERPRNINSRYLASPRQYGRMDSTTERFLSRLLTLLYGLLYLAAAYFYSYSAQFVRDLYRASFAEVQTLYLNRQIAFPVESFCAAGGLTLILGGIFLYSQYFFLLRNHKLAIRRRTLWLLTAAQHLGFTIWFGYSVGAYLYRENTSLGETISLVAASVSFPLLIAILSFLQAQSSWESLLPPGAAQLCTGTKKTPYLTLLTFKIVGLGLLLWYLMPTSSGWYGLGEVILRTLCLSGITLPLSVLSLFRREAGAIAVTPLLLIAFCFWALFAGGIGVVSLLQG
jgi:hypothetical protein